MKSVFILLLGFKVLSQVDAGYCRNSNTQQIRTCTGDRSFPETNCTCFPGWWGRRCEYPLECQIPGDLCAYRGTVNTTVDNRTCLPWTRYPDQHPADGISAQNHCRKSDKDDFIWCYYDNDDWHRCTVPSCDDQCTPPDLPIYTFVRNRPNLGFQVGSNLTIDCAAGYGRTGAVTQLMCDQNKRWAGTVTGCQQCDDGKFGINCNGSCQCNRMKTTSCNKKDGRCTCKTGWTGVTCNEDSDECTSKPCPHNQMCNNTAGSYQCYCPIGTQSNSFGFCEEINCEVPRLKAHSGIVNRRTSYRYMESVVVLCDDGYETTDQTNFTCIANNEFDGNFPKCTVTESRMCQESSKSVEYGVIAIMAVAFIAVTFFLLWKLQRQDSNQIPVSAHKTQHQLHHVYDKLSPWQREEGSLYEAI